MLRPLHAQFSKLSLTICPFHTTITYYITTPGLPPVMAAKPHAGKKVAGSIRPWVVKTINMLHPSHPSEKALPSADAPVWPSRSSLAALEGYLSGEKKNEVPAYLQYTSDIFLWIPSTNSKFIYIFLPLFEASK